MAAASTRPAGLPGLVAGALLGTAKRSAVGAGLYNGALHAVRRNPFPILLICGGAAMMFRAMVKLSADMAEQLQQARAAVAATQKDLAGAQAERDRVISERGQVEQAVQKLTSDREGGMSDLEALRKRQADAQAQLATLTEGMAARNKELAGLDDRLGATHQELGVAQTKLAEVRQQLSGQPALGTLPKSD